MRAKVRKSLNFLLQIVIILVAYGFIYKQVIQKIDASKLIPAINEKLSDTTFLLYFISAFLLMFVNLGVEAQKWRFLIGKFENVSFLNSFKAVFSGVTVSVFTPNRVGEYFGRVFILKHLHPFKGVLITFVGSMGQLMATILTGLICTLFFLPKMLDLSVSMNQLVFLGIAITTLITLALLVLLYLNFPVLSVFLRRLFPASREKFDKYTGVFESYSTANLTYVLMLSIIRYLVFTTQFILLLLAFGIQMPLLHFLVIIPVIFLVMTVIPTIALSDLGIRGSVSFYLIGLYFNDGSFDLSSVGIIIASTMLWLINLAIPAVTGTFFVFNLRFIRAKMNTPGP